MPPAKTPEDKDQVILIVIFLVLFSLGYYIYNKEDGSTSETKDSFEMSEAKKFAWMEKGKAAIKNRLKDPDSADFRNVAFHYNRSYSPVTCGEVNSKNSLGGYGGFKRFISAGSAEFTFLESDMKDKQEFDDTWFHLCQNQGKLGE